MAGSKLAIGLIGAGAIGRLHAQHLAFRVPGGRLAAVADVSRAAADACAAQCGGPPVHGDYHDLLADRGIDAVAICSPAETHTQIIEEAAQLGKHIFCEKPLDYELGKIDRALAATAEAGVKLQVGFNRRFDVNFRYVHDAVASGKIGRPYILHIISRDPQLGPTNPSRIAGELFLEMTVHDLDMARYLIASEVTSVYTLADAMVGGAAPIDTAVIALRFANGAMGAIDNGETAYGYDQRVEVFGSEGTIAVENERPHRATLTDREGSHAALPLHFFAERYAASYLAEMAAFVDCVLRDREPPVTGAEGRAAVVLALAAQRSYEEGRPVNPAEVDQR